MQTRSAQYKLKSHNRKSKSQCIWLASLILQRQLLLFHVSQLKTHFALHESGSSLETVPLWSHKHCDKYISMSSLLKAMNQSSLHAIKAERGCDYYCTKYYVVRVPFFWARMFFLLLVTDECFMAPWPLAHDLDAVRGPSHSRKTAFKQTYIVIMPDKGLWCSTKECGYLHAACVKASLVWGHITARKTRAHTTLTDGSASENHPAYVIFLNFRF